jgi:tetratricopeptide (TPR) repeat protein
MRNLLLILLALIFTHLSLPAFADQGPLKFPMRDDSNTSAHKHNEEGIFHYNQGHYAVALKHFQKASKANSSVGESHYNEALCLDKMGKHGEATNHFYAARKYAKGNSAIIGSKVLNAHAPIKREGS